MVDETKRTKHSRGVEHSRLSKGQKKKPNNLKSISKGRIQGGTTEPAIRKKRQPLQRGVEKEEGEAKFFSIQPPDQGHTGPKFRKKDMGETKLAGKACAINQGVNRN